MIRRQMSTRRVAQEPGSSHRTGFTTLAALTLSAFMPISIALAGPGDAAQAPQQYQQGTEQYQQGSEQYQQGSEQYQQGAEQYSSGSPEQSGYSGEGVEKATRYPVYPKTLLNDPKRSYRVRLSAELGPMAVVSHSLQLGQNGTRLDMRKDAGQSLLFPFARIEGNLAMRRNHFTLVYQPLELDTRVVLSRDVVIGGMTFAKGTAVDSRTGFPFWRTSYLYDFASTAGNELSLGASLQLRDTVIDLTSGSGTLRGSHRLVTAMPSIKFRAKKSYSSGYFVGMDTDAFYASVPFLNGTMASNVRGLIIDTSLQAGVKLRPGVESFVNLRYIGVGNEGNLPSTAFSSAGFSRDWIHVIALTAGMNLM